MPRGTPATPKQIAPKQPAASKQPVVSIVIEHTTGAVTATAPSLEVLGETLEKMKTKAAAA